MLERIHYLLVAGYDVYGTLCHQLTSRLHMDFLRMQGEKNLLVFLPPAARERTRTLWYRDAPESALHYMANPVYDKLPFRGIGYKTNDPLNELYAMLLDRLEPVQPGGVEVGEVLVNLQKFKGEKTRLLPHHTLIRVNGKQPRYVSLIRNDAHLNMSSVFREARQLVPAENTVTVVPGIRGFYPNALLQIEAAELSDFVGAMLTLSDETDYARLLDTYGIRRTDPRFWVLSDLE